MAKMMKREVFKSTLDTLHEVDSSPAKSPVAFVLNGAAEQGTIGSPNPLVSPLVNNLASPLSPLIQSNLSEYEGSGVGGMGMSGGEGIPVRDGVMHEDSVSYSYGLASSQGDVPLGIVDISESPAKSKKSRRRTRNSNVLGGGGTIASLLKTDKASKSGSGSTKDRRDLPHTRTLNYVIQAGKEIMEHANLSNKNAKPMESVVPQQGKTGKTRKGVRNKRRTGSVADKLAEISSGSHEDLLISSSSSSAKNTGSQSRTVGLDVEGSGDPNARKDGSSVAGSSSSTYRESQANGIHNSSQTGTNGDHNKTGSNAMGNGGVSSSSSSTSRPQNAVSIVADAKKWSPIDRMLLAKKRTAPGTLPPISEKTTSTATGHNSNVTWRSVGCQTGPDRVEEEKVAKFKAEIKKCKQKIQEGKEEIASRDKIIQDKEMEIESVRQEVAGKQTEVDLWIQKHGDQENQYTEQAKIQQATIETMKKMLQDAIVDKEHVIKKMQGEINGLRSDKEHAERGWSAAEAERNELMSRLETEQAGLLSRVETLQLKMKQRNMHGDGRVRENFRSSGDLGGMPAGGIAGVTAGGLTNSSKNLLVKNYATNSSGQLIIQAPSPGGNPSGISPRKQSSRATSRINSPIKVGNMGSLHPPTESFLGLTRCESKDISEAGSLKLDAIEGMIS